MIGSALQSRPLCKFYTRGLGLEMHVVINKYHDALRGIIDMGHEHEHGCRRILSMLMKQELDRSEAAFIWHCE